MGRLSQEIRDAADLTVHGIRAEAGVDEDGANLEAGGFQQEVTAIGQVDYGLQYEILARRPNFGLE